MNVTKPPIVRELLQEYGTEVRRADEPDYWVDKWLENVGRLKAITAGRVRVCAPDTRFWNEARAIKTLGGLVIHVSRPMPTFEDAEQGLHESERSLWNYPFDARFHNEGCIEDLWQQVDTWARERL